MSEITAEERALLRRRAQTDLFFLAKNVLGKDLTEHTHRAVCNFFVQKNPDLTIAQQDTIKDRLLLYPRGSYKSTLNVVDCVQWIICFPNIRILILTGADNLAHKFVAELRDYFAIKNDDPTNFQQLFPEFCYPSTQSSREGMFISPARTKYSKEPTVWASSIESHNSGDHCDVEKMDDILTDRNTETGGQLEKLTNRFYMTRELLMPYGYLDVVGTRYAPGDTYGDILEKAGIKEPYGDITVPKELKYLCKPAWWVKGTDFTIPKDSTPEDDIQLLFPEGLSYAFLKQKRGKNRRVFSSQQLNDPLGSAEVTFIKEDLVAATLPYTQFPTKGHTFIAWDLAYSVKKGRDFTVGAVCTIDEQSRLWILHLFRDRYQPHELPYVLVKAIADWQPERTAIEDTTGAKWLLAEMNRYAQQMLVPLKIDWFPPQREQFAKESRIKSLQSLLLTGRLKFSSTIGCLDDLYREFTQFPNGHHDDIPDAIGHLLRFIPHALMPLDPEQLNAARQQEKDRDIYNRLYNLGPYAPPEQPVAQERFDPYTLLPT